MSDWPAPYVEAKYEEQGFLRRTAIMLFSDAFVHWYDGSPRYAFYRGIRYSFEMLV